MRWSVIPLHPIVWLLGTGGVVAAGAPGRTITLEDLPRLVSVHEPVPNLTLASDGEAVSSQSNASVYISVPPISMDQQLYITINVCSLSSSTQYPTVLASNGTSFLSTIAAENQAVLSPWDDSYLAEPPKVDRSSGFNEKAKANQVREVLRGQYVWDIKLDGNAGFANWTGWMGDGGMIGIFASPGDAIDAEIGLRLGGEPAIRFAMASATSWTQLTS